MEPFVRHVSSPSPDRVRGETRERNHEKSGVDGRPRPLWLAVHFPWLSGEVLIDGRVSDDLLAVSEESRRGWLVHRASPGARRQGVQPGMTVSAASVICPGLAVRRRRPGLEKQRLQEIGAGMLSFSPIVSIQPPEILLIEVRGSLNLFRGLERLRMLIANRLDATGHVYRIAGAPTALAAKHLARWGREVVVEEKTALRSALGAMPVAGLDLDRATTRRLARAGIHILRDLWRLPTDGLARRFGTTLVRELDRLQGRHPDPQPLYESPLHYSSALMLDWATDDLAQINRGVEHLVQQWADYLRRSQRGTSGFSIICLPEARVEKVRVDIGLRHISRDMDHLRRLAFERLERLELEGPVTGLVLDSRRIHSLAGRSRQLFETDGESNMQWRQSEELLAIHLGGHGLDPLRAVAEHRPELAWSMTADPPAADRSPAACGPRPLWLLNPPRPLHWTVEAFRHRDRSTVLKGPERIETGWWDRRDQRRDYYVATDPRGRRLWIFQDLKRGQWYLHGLFA